MATHHHRTTSSCKKTRPLKPPALSKRNYSATHLKESKKSVHIKEDNDVEDESMAASFLQYCAYCENQIITPSNSLLYCSESCKRKDHNKSFSYHSTPHDSPPSTPLATFTFDDLPHRDVVPQLSPTSAIQRYSYSETSEDEHNTSEDERRYGQSRSNSEAARYLRQFHGPNSFVEPSMRTPRPRYNRSSTSTAALSAAPSLSHTPTSSVSMSMPYTPSARPLPPRNNPHSSSYTSKSVDLVTPFTSMPLPLTTLGSLQTTLAPLKTSPISKTSTGFAEGEMRYEKKSSLPSRSPDQGSLKQLLSYSQMPGSSMARAL